MCETILFQFISKMNLQYWKRIILYSIKHRRGFKHSQIILFSISLIIDSKSTNNILNGPTIDRLLRQVAMVLSFDGYISVMSGQSLFFSLGILVISLLLWWYNIFPVILLILPIIFIKGLKRKQIPETMNHLTALGQNNSSTMYRAWIFNMSTQAGMMT